MRTNLIFIVCNWLRKWKQTTSLVKDSEKNPEWQEKAMKWILSCQEWCHQNLRELVTATKFNSLLSSSYNNRVKTNSSIRKNNHSKSKRSSRQENEVNQIRKRHKTKSTPDRKEQQQKSSKKEEQKKKKNAQIEAGRTQAAAFFKDRLSAADNQNKEQPAGLVNHSPSPPSHPHSPLLQNTSLPAVTLPAPSHTVSQPMYGLSPLLVNLPSQSPDQSRMNLPRETDPPSLGISPLTLHRNPPSHTSLPTQSSTLYNASLLQPSQSSPEHESAYGSPSPFRPKSATAKSVFTDFRP